MNNVSVNTLNQLTAHKAAQKIKQREITSQELVLYYLECIKKRDNEINAWAHLNPHVVLANAASADHAISEGTTVGPLHGVPIAIKDIIDTTDFPTEHGCPIFKGNRPATDAPVVENLRNAGAIILGKTVTTELALLTPALTKNPANTEHSPGGSSSGSAAAVACDMVPAALGTQTAGSILRPASYCGVVGYKPTLGLVPRRGILMQSHTLDTAGVLTRSLHDAALLVLAMSSSEPRSEIRQHLSQFIDRKEPTNKPNFAFVKTPVWDQVEPTAAEQISTLAENLGQSCQETEIDLLANVIEWHRLVHLAENVAYYGPLQDNQRDQLSDGLNQRLDEGACVPVRNYIEAVSMQNAAAREIERTVFSKFTTILTPAAAGVAPKGFTSTGTPIFNGLWTYLGFPAVSIPFTDIDGLPLGIQLVAARGQDAALLQDTQWLTDFLENSKSA